MRDRVSYSARAHRTVIWGSVTQNDAADVRLFARAVAAGVGAEGDGKFAYTMKQSRDLQGSAKECSLGCVIPTLSLPLPV